MYRGVGLVINPSTYVADEGEHFLFGGDIVEFGFKLENTRKLSRSDSEKLRQSMLFENDLVCVRVGYPGVTAVVPKELEGSNCASVMIIRCGDFNSRWLCYILNSWVGRQQINKVQYGAAQKQFNISDAVNFMFPLPSDYDQEKITFFLDHETAKIDTLIDKQQQLIKLLKEKRQAVISHAVTKGLNPNVPMKDSGVEWLGEVPEYWVVTRAKFLFDLITSGSRGWAEFYADEGALFFRIANLTRDTIEPKLESIQYVNPPTGAEGGRAEIRNDDLLISITADLGSVCVTNNEIEGGFVSQHVSLCRPNNKVAASRWLGYFVLSDCAKEQLLGSGYGGTKIQLSLEDIRELCIALPSGDEQAQIANFIDVELSKFTKIMEKANAQIGLLQERRAALISAAVTGKIDVRGWQVEQRPSPQPLSQR
ncbi:restriction endonuclease subunit S [Thiothrix sp.]|uniref:restriction endonuclease subunit S n=1 Tax=Thiothrix sp. TaxID=1032 RepID=UPI00261343FB|nr:restriction endonuclease subunit S [Thiothrix sp.]